MIRPAAAARLTVPVTEDEHVLGPLTAPVTVVEYGDYECPHCGQAHPMVKQLHLLLGRRLCFVFRHFPLTTVHPHAQQAAEAAGGGVQGQFWEMHDVLFTHQQALDEVTCCSMRPRWASMSPGSAASWPGTSMPRACVSSL